MALQLGVIAWLVASVPVSIVVCAAMARGGDAPEVLYRDEHVMVLADAHGVRRHDLTPVA